MVQAMGNTNGICRASAPSIPWRGSSGKQHDCCMHSRDNIKPESDLRQTPCPHIMPVAGHISNWPWTICVCVSYFL